MPSNLPIGIFDSGVGGLTVARAIKDALPNERLVYFGDTLHLPYGEKSPASIIRYSVRITDFLLEKKCKAIVIACNSASAHAFDQVKSRVPDTIPVLNVIDPMVNFIKQDQGGQSVGVIGTKATIRSQVYKDRLQPVNSKSLETPLLASMIEEGFVNNEVSKAVINAYLSQKTLDNITSLVLACTHYPLLMDDIKNFYKNSIPILSSGVVVAQELVRQLNKQNSLSEHQQFSDEFYVSDYTSFFEKTTSRFFSQEIKLQELKIT
jgi:glutamate racemase